MTERTKPFIRVAVWYLPDHGYGVVGMRRGPTVERIGGFHPSKEQAMQAARFVPRKHQDIHFEDMSRW